MTVPEIDAFNASLKRCLASTRFLADFYDGFIASSEDVRRKFEHTDFERQTRMVADSLYMMAVAAQTGKDSVAWAEMSRLADRHGGNDLAIRPELYDRWLECLLAAVRSHDPQFSPEVEANWRRTLGPGIDYMRSRY